MSVPPEVEKWFSEIPHIVEPTTTQARIATSLIGGEGLKILLGLLLAERQGYFIQLTFLNMADKDQRALASVIQGKIQGIERVTQTLLSLYPDEGPASEGGKTNG